MTVAQGHMRCCHAVPLKSSCHMQDKQELSALLTAAGDHVLLAEVVQHWDLAGASCVRSPVAGEGAPLPHSAVPLWSHTARMLPSAKDAFSEPGLVLLRASPCQAPV